MATGDERGKLALTCAAGQQKRGEREQQGAFMRKGVVGDWAATFTAEMNEGILARLGWLSPHFGWER